MTPLGPALRCNACNKVHYLSGGGLCLDCSDAGRRAVEAWSLRIHDRNSDRHTWCITAANALIAGTFPPLWPGGRQNTGLARLVTIRSLLKLQDP